MKHQCLNCGYVHTDSHLKFPGSKFVLARWFRARDGVDRYCGTCLECGAIHVMRPRLANLFGGGYKIESYVMPDNFINEYRAIGGDHESLQRFLMDHMNLPPVVYDRLCTAGYFDPET